MFTHQPSKTVYRQLLWSVLLFLVQHTASGQERMDIVLNKTGFNAGDTIAFRCYVDAWQGTKKLGTLHVLVQDVNKRQQWRFRFAVMDGYSEGAFVVGAGLPPGSYALHFSMQPAFFQLNGILTGNNPQDSIRYSLLLGGRQLYNGTIAVAPNGQFRLPRLAFTGPATVFFTPIKVGKSKNTLDAVISTPLDSSFTPLFDTLIMTYIGKPDKLADVQNYKPDTGISQNESGATLSTVVVKGKLKTAEAKVEEEQVSGFFKSDRAMNFSGFEGEFSGYLNIFDYLRSRVPGLEITQQAEEFGTYVVTYRYETPVYFIDEIQVDLESMINFPMSEIALIKVYRPPFLGSLFGGSGGAIAIYSKKAKTGYQRYRNKFVVYGFSQPISVLRPVAYN